MHTKVYLILKFSLSYSNFESTQVMQLNFLGCTDKFIGKQIKLTECVYHTQ